MAGDRGWYDGDTLYDRDGGHRLHGADAPERRANDPGWRQARDASVLADQLGFTPGRPEDRESYGRKIQSFDAPNGDPSLDAELLGGKLASGLPQRMGGGTYRNEYLEGARALTGSQGSALSNHPDFLQAVDDARFQRLERLREGLQNGSFGQQLDALKPIRDPRGPENERGFGDQVMEHELLGRAFGRGVDNTQSMFYGFMDALGDATGVDVLSEWGEQGAARNVVEAMRNPATIARYDDIDGYADVGIYALEAIAENSPQLLFDVGAGVATGGTALLTRAGLAGLGKALMRNTGGSLSVGGARKLGAMGFAKGGAFASMYMQSAGETQNQLVAEGVDSPGTALAVGAAKAGLDYLGLDTVLRQGLKGLGKAGTTPDGVGQMLANAAKSAGVAATTESLTEATQTLMDEMAIMAHKPEHEIDIHNVIDAMLKGGIAGGATAGAGNAAVGTLQMAMRQPKNTDPVVDTDEESLASVKAQLAAMPEGKVRHFSAANAEAARAHAAEAGKFSRVIEGGHVQVANTQAELDALPANPTEADNAAMLGYAQTKEEAAADPAGVQAVVVRNAEGVVIESQAVGASKAAEVAQAYQAQYGDAKVEITTPEAVIAERRQQIAAEKAPAVNAPGGLRAALKATAGKVAEAAGEALPTAKNKAPAKAKLPAPAPDISDVTSTGVNPDNLPASADFDRIALDRMLVARLNNKAQGSDTTLAEELGDRKVRELSDKEVRGYAQQFGIELDALPRAKGTVQNDAGQASPTVDKAYRAAAAGSLMATLHDKIANGKLRADLTPLANFLGLDPAMAVRSAYDKADAYREAVAQAVATKYGTRSAMVRAMTEADYSPAEVSDMLAAIGAPEPKGFKFQADKRVTPATVKAAVAARLPTKETNPHPGVAEARTEKQKAQEVEGAKVQARTERAVGIVDKLRAHPQLGRFFTPGMENNKGVAKLTGLLGVGKEAEGLRESALATLTELGVDTKLGLEALIDYTDALIETARLQKRTAATEVVQDGEPEDGADLAVEVIAAEQSDPESDDRVRELNFLRASLEKFQKAGLKLTDVSKSGYPSGFKAYAMVLTQLARIGDIQDIDLREPLLGENGQKAMREATVLSAAIYGLGNPALSVSTLRDSILEFTGLTDADLASLSLITPDGTPITAAAAVDGLASTANKFGDAARSIIVSQVAPDGDPTPVAEFFGRIEQLLASDNAAARLSGLRMLHHHMRWVDLGKLQAVADARRANSDGSKPASAKGVGAHDAKAQDKSEQQLSDWTFFGAMRRARAFLRAPLAMRKKDGWRRKEGEPSIFDTHDTWVVDFESFFDTAQGYSLGMMDQDDYIRDPRFSLHGVAVTAPGQETRYLTSMADMQAFVGELRASEKPVALVAHNAKFDGNVMSEIFGFEPDVWIDTLEISRLADPMERSHDLGSVAQRLGMTKPVESLAATDGKKDLAGELSAEELAAFDTYARGDADIALAYLRVNEPSVAYVAEASAALRVVRKVAGVESLSMEHFDFGDTSMRGVVRSMETTRLTGGANLLMIPHRSTMGGSLVTLPFDAVALGEFSQSGNKKAETAADAARNLVDALARLLDGPQSEEVGVGLKSDTPILPHDNTVIFLDPETGRGVTFGEAIAGKQGMQSRDGSLLAAERSQEKLRHRLEEVQARLNGIAATLYEQQKDEPSALRAAALDVWTSRINGDRLSDQDIEDGAVPGWSNGTELLKEVRKIGNSVNAPRQTGMKLSLADNFSEKLSILGELARASEVAKKAKDEGAEGNQLDDEQAARIALAAEANALLTRAGGADKAVAAATEQLDKLATYTRGKMSDTKRKEAREKQRGVESLLELALAAKEWSRGEGKIYPSDIPQHAVDSLLRGDGFATVTWGAANIRDGEGNMPTDGRDLTAEDPSAGDNREGLKSGQREDGTERRGPDGFGKLYDYAGESRAADMATAIQARGGETRLDARVFDTARTPAQPTRKVSTPGPKAEADPDARAPGRKTPVLGFENKLGADFNFLSPFLTRLRELNVPLDNVTLLSHSALDALWLANQNTELGQLLIQLERGDGSAYFSHNGRSYVLIDRDPSEKAAAMEDLAHELGHVTKDRVWADLLAEDRAALEAEFAKAHPTAVADELMLHEWFADQFMRAVVAQVSKAKGPNAQEQAASGFAQKIAELLNIIRNIWDAVSKTGELSVGFEQFANRLFSGGYRGAGVSAPATSSIYYASGADMLSQTEANRLQMGVNKVKQGWKKGVVPSFRNVMGTVIGQIEAIDPQLAALMFQRANADSTGTRAYEQTHVALAQRMMAEKDRLIASLSTAKGKKRTAEVQAALGDAFTGAPKTEAGKKARAGLDQLAALARKEGLKTVHMADGFPIAVFDREAVERNRAAFVAKLVEKLKVSTARAGEIYLGIVEGTGSLEGAIAPGLPVGMHISTREILAAIPYTELRDAGWLLQEHEAALQHWVGGVAKRAAWERTFGGFTMGNARAMAMQMFGEADPDGTRLAEAGMIDDFGRVFNPNAKLHEGLDRIRKTGGEQAAQRVLNLLDGVMGRTGANMPQGLRKAQDFVLAFVNMLTLGFSGLHSIPELGTPLVRAGGKVGLSDMPKSIAEGRRLAESLGFVLSDASQRIVWQATGEQYQSPLAQKMNYWLFRINMNQMVTNYSRTLATGVGAQYLLQSAADGDHAALARLNIDAATVRAWESLGKQAPSIGQNDAVYAINARVADALAQFVSEATVSPSRFQATHWGNNPMFKIVWHLKHFMWAFGDTVLGGMWRDAKRRFSTLDGPAFNRALAAAAPAMIFALVMMPLAAGALEMRDWLRRLNDTRVEERTAAEYFAAMFDRAGGLGPLAFVAGAYKAQSEYGVSAFGSLAPTLGKVDMLFTDYGKDGEVDKRELLWKVRQMTPIWSQNKTMFGLLE